MGAASSNSTGWLIKISLAFIHKPLISCSASWTGFPGRLPLTSSNRWMMLSTSISTGVCCAAIKSTGTYKGVDRDGDTRMPKQEVLKAVDPRAFLTANSDAAPCDAQQLSHSLSRSIRARSSSCARQNVFMPVLFSAVSRCPLLPNYSEHFRIWAMRISSSSPQLCSTISYTQSVFKEKASVHTPYGVKLCTLLGWQWNMEDYNLFV